jgi:hypothetical protein
LTGSEGRCRPAGVVAGLGVESLCPGDWPPGSSPEVPGAAQFGLMAPARRCSQALFLTVPR